MTETAQLAIPSAPNVAVFLDFENLHLSAQNVLKDQIRWDLVYRKFQEYGTITLKRAYANWVRFDNQQAPLLSLGFELIHTPAYHEAKPNDTRMIIDAVTLGADPNIGVVILGTGDSDFVDVVHYLRGKGKRVVGFGIQATTASNLIHALDEFLAYERFIQTPEADKTLSEADQERVSEYLQIISRLGKVRMTPSPHRPRVVLMFHQAIRTLQEQNKTFSEIVETVRQRARKAHIPDNIVTEVAHQIFRAYALDFQRPDGEDDNKDKRLWDYPVRLRKGLENMNRFIDWCDLWLVARVKEGLQDGEEINLPAMAHVLYGHVRPKLLNRTRDLVARATKLERWPPDSGNKKAS
ncbi:MAG: NYN domain-containing protein [Chloroflexi bacterium]|nr:NYN domain-containing protein [Chloroflexota bacterium]